MNQKIIVGLLVFFMCSCAKKQDNTNLNRSELTKSQWISSKLFEEPDLRDTFIFHDDNTFTFFGAASLTNFSGVYKIKGDTVVIIFKDQELKPAEQYKLLYQKEKLIHIYSEFGKKVIKDTSGRLRYTRAPLDRDLY